MKNIDNYFIH